MVSKMLPVVSRGCLALTCKTYHTQFIAVFRDEIFNLAKSELDLSVVKKMASETVRKGRRRQRVLFELCPNRKLVLLRNLSHTSRFQ